MTPVATIGLDIAKNVFQVHGVDAAGQVVVRRRLSRGRVLAFFEKLKPCLVGIEACGNVALLGTGTHCAGARSPLNASAIREALREARQERRGGCRGDLRGRNAANDALRARQNAGAAKRDDAAPGKADAQPPAHPAFQFDPRASLRVRHRRPIGRRGIDQLLAIVADENDTRVPAAARLCLQMLAAQLAVVKEQILENDRRVRASARKTELGCRLMEVPGVGPLVASAFIATVADPAAFKTGRDLAAWIGLVPKQNSSGGKERLGSITKAGNRYLRQMLVVGAMAVIRYAERHGTCRPWLVQLMQRRSKKVAAVALANKMARINLGVDDKRRTLSRTGRRGMVSSIETGAAGRRSKSWEGRTGVNAQSRLKPPARENPLRPKHFECEQSIGT